MSIEQVLKNLDALDAKLDAALTAQPPLPVQEPVAWMWKDMRGQDIVSLFEPRLNSVPLYATPPQRPWVGLTDEDCKGMSAGDKMVAMWANRILRERNK